MAASGSLLTPPRHTCTLLRAGRRLTGLPTSRRSVQVQAAAVNFTRAGFEFSGSPREYNGKNAVITGGNTGIGYETARALAYLGYQTVIVCRNADKGRAAKERIRAEFPWSKVEVVNADLANLATLREFAKRALDFGHPIDVMVNNAGVMATPQMDTVDGFELQFGTNHLGHFAWTFLLMPLMSDPSRPTRIINVASEAHKFGTIQFDDLMRRRNYSPWPVYGQSKLANVLAAYELHRRLPPSANITVNALHPGVVTTELWRYLLPEPAPWWQKPLMSAAGPFLKTPAQGAATSIYLAASPEAEGISGKYFVDRRPATTTRESYDVEVARRLWDVSQELTGVAAELPKAEQPAHASAPAPA